MSKILSTHCEDSQISIAMDDMSYPHCVWVDGGTIKYARFCGDEWRVAGGTAVAMSSDNVISVSKHCLGFDGSWNPFFVAMDGQDLILVSWNGVAWTREIVWSGAGSYDPLAWAAVWADFPVVIAITRSYGNKKIWSTDKSTGSWGAPNDETIPSQDNEDIELKATRVASWVYAFWNGKNNGSGTAWIGHAAWDIDSQTWVYLPDKKVGMSAAEGDIGGIDFVAWDELLSSSSSSSSSSSQTEPLGIGDAVIEKTFIVS